VNDLLFLRTLENIIDDRLARQPEESYTARIAAQGTAKLAQKVGEEGVEVALAAVIGKPAELVGEAADLLFHLMVLLRTQSLSLDDVVAKLAERHSAATSQP
jgi:phosphoribosyl-ATP pyrophosphohydrolase/phosphoribosyl-AMP cyclohydrolase